VVEIAFVYPDSSSGTPLRPAWSFHGSAQTPSDRLSAKITDPAVLTSARRGRETDRMDHRTITDGLQELAAMIGAVA
jgi:hypothetical protein